MMMFAAFPDRVGRKLVCEPKGGTDDLILYICIFFWPICFFHRLFPDDVCVFIFPSLFSLTPQPPQPLTSLMSSEEKVGIAVWDGGV